ncbi:MAG: hypothetical protein HYV29_11615 [Ignavibacteriales bacterium]|nr:hypothetical protein [Ignavibacteriales bacterium]
MEELLLIEAIADSKNANYFSTDFVGKNVIGAFPSLLINLYTCNSGMEHLYKFNFQISKSQQKISLAAQ